MFKRMFCTLSILAIPSLAFALPDVPQYSVQQQRMVKQTLARGINQTLTAQLKKQYIFPARYLNLVKPQAIKIGSVAKDGFILGRTLGKIHYSLASKYTKPGYPTFVPQSKGPFAFSGYMNGLHTVKKLIVEKNQIITLPPPGRPQ